MNRWNTLLRIMRETLWRTGHWGINGSQVRCPTCDAVMPRIRRPRNERQRLWGGWTCSRCGTEMDKWGRRMEEQR